MTWINFALMFSSIFFAASAKIGYFWQISDIHYDADYSIKGDQRKRCWVQTKGKVGTTVPPMGKFGDYNCDSPWPLVESAVRTMKEFRSEVEFILWTGDGLTHFGGGPLPQVQLKTLQNVTDLLHRTFNSQFVFPVLGNEEYHDRPRKYHGDSNRDYEDLADLWRHWLPTEAIQTFEKGGYYTIEIKEIRIRIIALNTNLVSHSAGREDDPGGQWAWLESVLEKSKHHVPGTPWKVYIVGNIPPGVDERQGTYQHSFTSNSFQERFNTKYLDLVRRYHKIIAGQFFGHLHSDTFRIVYNNDEPVSWIFVSPAISPKKELGPSNNPGFRLYKFNTDNGHVLDYIQFYLDLERTSTTGEPRWQVEYNLTSYYDLSEISSMSLNDLVERFRYKDSEYLKRYYRANSVRLDARDCSDTCRDIHYCAITRLDYREFQGCIEARASALSSNVTKHKLNSCIFFILLIVQIVYARSCILCPFNFS